MSEKSEKSENSQNEAPSAQDDEQRMLEAIRDAVKQYGFCVINQAVGFNGIPMSATVGMASQRLPDFFISGNFPPGMVGGMVHRITQKWLSDGKIGYGQEDSILVDKDGGAVSIQIMPFIPNDDQSHIFSQIFSIYEKLGIDRHPHEEIPPFVQVVWPDTTLNSYPGTERYDYNNCPQVLVFNPAHYQGTNEESSNEV